MCFSEEGEGLYVTCSQEKWEKGQKIVRDLYDKVVEKKERSLNRKDLEKNIGFLVHLSRTFPAIFPYMKELYHMMEAWRVGRDSDGWRLGKVGWCELLSGISEDLPFEEAKKNFKRMKNQVVPKDVKPVPRLTSDLEALCLLFDFDKPPKRLVRGSPLSGAKYGFGDASGGGFGGSWQDDGKIFFRFGTWSEEMDDSSSNLWELKNLVDTLKEMGVRGVLKGMEVFIFTDNSTAEGAFFNGSSSSQTLHDLVLELRNLEMTERCRIHITHVAGTRMIAQGSDGLSRGNVLKGCMRGVPLLSYVPLDKSPLERSPKLKEWIRSWTQDDVEFLDPVGWFTRGHDLDDNGVVNEEGIWIPNYKFGSYIWTPPPAAGEAAIEELRKAWHKRQKLTHLFVIPRLMQPYWRKHMFKCADVVLTVPPGHPAWPVDMHEPLILGICYPYLPYRPWELRRCSALLGLGKCLSQVWSENPSAEGPILRELWSFAKRLEGLSPQLARQVLSSESGFKVPYSDSRKRRGHPMEQEERRKKIR